MKYHQLCTPHFSAISIYDSVTLLSFVVAVQDAANAEMANTPLICV